VRPAPFREMDKQRGIQFPLSFDAHVFWAMRSLALYMYSQEQPQMRRQELVGFIKSYLLEKRFDDADIAESAAEEFIDFCKGRAWVLTDVGEEKYDSAQWRWYGSELALPEIAPARAFVAFGWTHSQLFGSTGETLPYVGIKLDGASQQVFATAKELLRDAAQACHWPKSEGNWVWYSYLPFGASDTDLDAYAEKQMDGLVAAHALVQSALPLR
jgi:hypothetical protein